LWKVRFGVAPLQNTGQAFPTIIAGRSLLTATALDAELGLGVVAEYAVVVQKAIR
jgi:hypothetical protein